MTEQWKNIEGYNGDYQVSDMGRIRTRNNRWGVTDKYRILKQNKQRDGYHLVRLYLNSQQSDCLVSRLVANAFIPNPKNKKEVNHKDGNKSNNSASNLNWSTRSENMKHAFEMGLLNVRRGEDNNKSKLSEENVIEIRNTYAMGCFTQTEIAIAYNVTCANISEIVNYKTWKHV
jgi:hypothetical protein